MFVCYYTEQDLGGDISGMWELKSILQHGRVFIDNDNYSTAWANGLKRWGKPCTKE